MHLPVLNAEPAAAAELVEIQLGHMCNNRCVFCSSGQATQMGQALPMELAPILAALERAKRQRARKVTFLGGEPTLQRAFIPALRRAADLGFEEIEIFTNGVKAARASFVDEVAAIGRFSWRFSIQGGNERAHDEAVVKPGAFQRICKAMENVRRHRHRITANACINERSYRSLPDYVDLVRRHGIEQLHIDVVRPSSAGQRTDAYLGEIMPRHVDMAPYIEQMLAAFEAWDPTFDVNVGNYPYCLLPQWAHRIHHGGLETLTLASDLDNDLSEKNKYAAQHSDKLHGPRCRACAFESACSGVFDAYARIHGTDELRPVTAAAWAALDESGRRSALLERARAVTKRLEVASEALRVIEDGVGFEYRGVRVRMGSRGSLGIAVARVDGFDVSIHPMRPMQRDDATMWVDAVRNDDSWTAAPRSVWVAAMMGEGHVARGRRAIAALLKARSKGERHEPDAQWPGVRLVDAAGRVARVSIAWPDAPTLLEHS
ncbi:MAG: radical SAM protein [Nannocystaceae bacterium]|nr:radical SAM protein [bacterium]